MTPTSWYCKRTRKPEGKKKANNGIIKKKKKRNERKNYITRKAIVIKKKRKKWHLHRPRLDEESLYLNQRGNSKQMSNSKQKEGKKEGNRTDRDRTRTHCKPSRPRGFLYFWTFIMIRYLLRTVGRRKHIQGHCCGICVNPRTYY